jgi:hypothetical protein
MDEEETIALVDEITDLLTEHNITPGEWSALSARIQNELDARDED